MTNDIERFGMDAELITVQNRLVVGDLVRHNIYVLKRKTEKDIAVAKREERAACAEFLRMSLDNVEDTVTVNKVRKILIALAHNMEMQND